MSPPPLPQSLLNECITILHSLQKLTRPKIIELVHRSDLTEIVKTDDSPVTAVDLEIEELLREELRRLCPTHGVIGEEFGVENPYSKITWTLDPIDGTQNLVAGLKHFCTLIGVRFQGRAVLGLIDHPLLDELTVGGEKIGVTRNGRAVTIPKRPQIWTSREILLVSTPGSFSTLEEQRAFAELQKRFPNTRTLYDSGAAWLCGSPTIRAIVEMKNKLWDITPTEAIIPAAGGVIHLFDSDPSIPLWERTVGYVGGDREAVDEIASIFTIRKN